jgi:hypothetical protein
MLELEEVSPLQFLNVPLTIIYGSNDKVMPFIKENNPLNICVTVVSDANIPLNEFTHYFEKEDDLIIWLKKVTIFREPPILFIFNLYISFYNLEIVEWIKDAHYYNIHLILQLSNLTFDVNLPEEHQKAQRSFIQLFRHCDTFVCLELLHRSWLRKIWFERYTSKNERAIQHKFVPWVIHHDEFYALVGKRMCQLKT